MGYRPASPLPEQRIVWPGDFGQRYTIFVDTEEEFDWTAPLDRGQRSVTAIAAVPQAARRFAEAGACLTLLVDHPVATDLMSIEAIGRAMDDHGSGVGAQLHPWVNPPHDEAVGGTNSFVGNLPPALQAAKLDVLGAAIRDAFGRSPRTYRAGRYGLGEASFALLAERGYRIDSSMRAHYSYAGEGGPDYTTVGNRAFATGHPGLTEIPFTTVYTGALRRLGARLHPLAGHIPHGIGVLARSGLLNRVSLTPEQMPLAEALEAVAVAVGEGLPLLNFAFHSPTLVPGHTPYTRDAAGLASFWAWWDAVLAELARRGVACASETQIIDALDQTQ